MDPRDYAALKRIGDELAGIRVCFETLVSLWNPDEESQPCLHPPEQRIDFGTMGGIEDFQCLICGYRSVDLAASKVD